MFRELVIARDRNRLEASREVTRAYLTARYVRLERLPSLASELEKLERAGTGDQNVDQQRSALAVLSEQTGYPVRRGKPDDEVWIGLD